jgi:hypothetical protein
LELVAAGERGIAVGTGYGESESEGDLISQPFISYHRFFFPKFGTNLRYAEFCN